MSIMIKLILESVSFFAAIGVAVVLYRRDKKIAMLFSIVVAFATLCLGFFINNVPSPTINRKSDHSAIIISASDKAMKIEYKIASDTYSDDHWVEYTGPITLEKSAIVYARAKTLWFTSPETNRVAYLLDNGLVYFSDVEKPRDSVLSINANYNYKDPENGHAGNHYFGYEIKKEDITVTGITVDGIEKEITDFSYSPRRLSSNNNAIEVEYVITDETSLFTNLNVLGDSPRLIKLTANYTGQNIFPDTELDSNDFSVKGIYENGTQKEITGYSISSGELREGQNRIIISKDNLSCVVDINAVDRDAISISEIEPNNEIRRANDIVVNVKYNGTLKDEEDEDYYRLYLRNKGKIVLKLSHPKLGEDGDFWKASLLSQNEKPIVELTASGNNVDTESSQARVGAGVYYIKVKKHYFSSEKYSILALFEPEGDSYEDEPNDDLSSEAMNLSLDKLYTGNLSTRDDVDYYKFSLTQKRKIWIDFSHQKTSTNDTFWKLYLLGDSEGSIIDMESTGENASVISNCVRLSPGNYYIKVKAHYWTDLDYSFCVHSKLEGTESESEDNNDYGTATKLDMNSSIVGNLQSENDIDFYKIEIKKVSPLTVSFSHEQFDSGDTYWRLDLCSDQFSSAIQNDEEHTTLHIQGDSPNGILSHWSSLPAGIYYLKVYKYYFCNDDYTITISN